MAVRTWVAGVAGEWRDPNNWMPAGAPAPGDQLVVVSGSPSIEPGTIVGETISIQGSITLTIASVTFRPGSGHPLDIYITGNPALPTKATLATQGHTSFSGSLFVEAMAGGLAIDLAGGKSTSKFTIEEDGYVLVTQESALAFTGAGRVLNEGLVHVEGDATIGDQIAWKGKGIIELADHGHLAVDGAIHKKQTVLFGDGTAVLRIGDVNDFDARIGLTPYGGDRIVLEDVTARSAAYDDGVLTLYRGKNQSGPVAAELTVKLFAPMSLTPAADTLIASPKQNLSAKDFVLDRDGDDTVLHYEPQAPTYLQASLAMPVVAPTGTLVPLATLLKESLGTEDPGYYSMKLLPAWDLEGKRQYWGQTEVNGIDPLLSAWVVNGKVLTKPKKITAEDEVFYRVGNSISFPPQLRVQLTEKAKGRKAEYLDYSLWSVDPAVAALVQAAPGYVLGKPGAHDIINAAHAYQTVYGTVLNTDLCNWIADNVAAAAGATMPLPDADLDPLSNVSGGFWRVVYRGTDAETPTVDWNTIVQPGDIVRMKWVSSVSGHTTTVMAVQPDGKLKVYDNGDTVDGQSVIGEHGDVAYWTGTDPASITVYRLDPNGQYLIEGKKPGERLHGSIFDDLIYGRRGDDTILGSVGNDEIDAGQGRDRLFGGAGNDVLKGDAKGDRLDGGDGDDRYAYVMVGDSRPDDGLRDTILSFVRGADRIDLTALNASLAAKGKATFFFIGDKPFSGVAGELNYADKGGSVLLRGDRNGDGEADFALKVRGIDALDAGDFLL
ncbi:MAG TPA: M10 family metallopeptidase C-terminal domain-containing protein [Bauldia sp.]|nr:M10 family metallopeptidase C-terminal domain-containing protein [Bauldia sp.]